MFFIFNVLLLLVVFSILSELMIWQDMISEGLRRSQHVIMQVLSAQELEAAAERASGEWRTAEARLF